MDITSATRPGDGLGNEDIVIAGGHVAVLVSLVDPRTGGHPPAREICARLTGSLLQDTGTPLRELLSKALGPRAEPPAAFSVAVARSRAGHVDLLLQGDAAVLIQFPDLTVNEMAHSGRPGGPLIASLPASEARRVCLLSDGARTSAGRCGWDRRRILDHVAAEGPDAFLAKMRAAAPGTSSGPAPLPGAAVALCSA